MAKLPVESHDIGRVIAVWGAFRNEALPRVLTSGRTVQRCLLDGGVR